MTIRRLERLASKFVIDESGCWLWQAAKNESGYGYFRIGDSIRRAHRVLYQQVFGAVDKDKELDHLCRVRHCVNPRHLEQVTHTVNVARAEVGKRRQENTECRKGHSLTGDNLRVNPSGYKVCRECERVGNARRYWSNKTISKERK